MSDNEFDVLRDILSSFASSFDTMKIEQKRAAIRTFVKRIVWDGENIHMYLYGSEEEDLFEEPSGGDRKNNYLITALFEKKDPSVTELKQYRISLPSC